VQIYGDVHQGEFGYQLAVLNGVPDGGSGDADVNDGVDVAARLFGQPFVNTTIVPLRGLGVGVAGTWGREQGSISSPQLPTFKTSSRNTYFRYAADTPSTAAGTAIANGDHWRVSPQAYYYWGPFGSLFEYGISDQEISKNAVTADLQNTAWQVRASWLLTGEAASYKQVVPERNFDFGGGGWGAWELALRYANLDVDDDTFRLGFADATKSVSEIDSITAGVNWYLNRNVEWQLNYEHSSFDKGSKTGDRDPENVFLTRVQLVF
jgi:phosphate-selective porin OprO/OprP